MEDRRKLMTFEDLESWQQARKLTRDVYTGMLHSTESRKSKMRTALSALFHLLSPIWEGNL
jgi:hypothetical protein